ncbi:MAG: 3-dehydroquinate synthase [Desulfatibacillaceae bacterium]
MNALTIHGQQGESRILVGEALARADQYLPAGRCVVITDTNVSRLYRDRFPNAPIITVGTGEAVKTLDTVRDIYTRLLDLAADRSTFLLGIGGGIVCDITGFAAATYMRGVRFGFVATTLLAQVDASVGGKNGVNFSGYKNIVGTFTQPEFVICDPQVLATLPKKEVACGFAEIVKHALIASQDLFGFLESVPDRAIVLDEAVVNRAVLESVRIKSSVVSTDEREAGERKKLNFGHTYGHALEKVVGVSHGEAVAAGMMVAAKMSANRGMLPQRDVERTARLLKNLGLPTVVEAPRDGVLDAMARDKKRRGDTIDFVLLDGLGSAVVRSVELSELSRVVPGE